MSTIPTVEKIQGSKCDTCLRDCVLMCGVCGCTFCTKHLLVHSKDCNGYRAVIRAILRDDFKDTMNHVYEVVLRAI